MKGKKKENNSENSDNCMTTTFKTLPKEETTELTSPVNTWNSVSHDSNEMMNSHTTPKKALIIHNKKRIPIFGVN